MKTTIILPVSRHEHINRIFSSLELLECDKRQTNLLVMVDARDDISLFLKARNLTNESKFNEKLCVFYDDDFSGDTDTIKGRRIRISNIHNQIRSILTSDYKFAKSNYIFGVEDDTIVPPDALIKLHHGYMIYPNAGFIEGLELGRHSDTYVGAWRVDDIYTTSSFTSLSEQDISGEIQPIDSGGLYCFLTKYHAYIDHIFKPFENNDLGPDANFGISLRRDGYENFIDTSIRCIHLSGNDRIVYPKNKIVQIEVRKNKHGWTQRTID